MSESPSLNQDLLAEDLFIYLFWLHRSACRILVPLPGMKPCPLQWKQGALTTDPPGKSLLRISRWIMGADFNSQFYLFGLMCGSPWCPHELDVTKIQSWGHWHLVVV